MHASMYAYVDVYVHVVWYMVAQRYLSHYLPHTRPLQHTHTQSLLLDSSLSSCQPFVMGFSFDSSFIPDSYCRPCFAHFVRKLQYLLHHHRIMYRFLHLHTRPPDYNYIIYMSVARTNNKILGRATITMRQFVIKASPHRVCRSTLLIIISMKDAFSHGQFRHLHTLQKLWDIQWQICGD